MEQINGFENEKTFINGLKLTSALKHGTSVHELMKALSDKYNNEYMEKYKTTEPLFTYFTDSDLVNLIECKYNLTCNMRVDWRILNPK